MALTLREFGTYPESNGAARGLVDALPMDL